jgi:hypothetical protein
MHYSILTTVTTQRVITDRISKDRDRTELVVVTSYCVIETQIVVYCTLYLLPGNITDCYVVQTCIIMCALMTRSLDECYGASLQEIYL